MIGRRERGGEGGGRGEEGIKENVRGTQSSAGDSHSFGRDASRLEWRP